MGNHQEHTLAVFNHTAHKVMNDAISYAHIHMNNQYYKEVLHREMSKKLSSSTIYLIEEQYCPVKISMSFDIQHLRLVVSRRIDSIFVQVWILWFRNHEQDCLELCKLWSSSAFKALSSPRRRDSVMEKSRSIDTTLMGMSTSLNAS
jgi:hypothetical protein